MDDDSGIVQKRGRVKVLESKPTVEDLQLALPLYQIPI